MTLFAPPTADSFPIGAMVDFAATTAPDGWLLCDGSEISRSTYSRLFAVIGITWGNGDGATTYNLPNFTGRMAMGKRLAGAGSIVGQTGGTFSHTHSLTGSTINTSKEYVVTPGTPDWAWPEGPGAICSDGTIIRHHVDVPGHSHYHHAALAGATGSNNPPYGAVLKIIKY